MELQDIIRSKYADKVENSKVYSLYNIKKTLLLYALVIDKKKDKIITLKQQDIVKNVIANYSALDANLLTEFSKIISE